MTASSPGIARQTAFLAAFVVFTGFLLNFVTRGVVDTFMIFIVPLEHEFGWSRTVLTATYSIYLVTVGVMSPISGAMLHKFGPRAMYGAGVAILGLSMWGMSHISSLWQVYALNGIFCGIASSALGMVPAAALIAKWHDRHLSLAISLAYAGLGSGVLVIVPLAQIVIDADGWRAAYTAMTIALGLLLPAILVLPWSRISKGRLVTDDASPATAPPPKTAPPVAGTAPVKSLSGILWAARSREFWLLVQVFFFTAFSVYCVVVQVVAYLVESGYPAIDAALIFGVTGMLSIFGVVFAGWLSDRYGYRFTATLSFVGTFIGIAALFTFSTVPAPWLIVVYAVAFGMSQGARGPVVSTLTTRIFAKGSVGVIFGTVFMTMSFGSALGAWLSGLLHDLTGGYEAAFLVSGVGVLIAAAPFWLSDRLKNPRALDMPVAAHSP